MKLNPDCIRDILLTVEDTTDLHNWLAYPNEADRCPLLQNYDIEDVKYHFNQCLLSSLIIGDIADLNYDFIIKDLTPQGHAFVADIRSDTIWNKVKLAGKELGIYSLNSLVQIASSVVTNLITGHFTGT